LHLRSRKKRRRHPQLQNVATRDHGHAPSFIPAGYRKPRALAWMDQ
jgi:hypothetical protein